MAPRVQIPPSPPPHRSRVLVRGVVHAHDLRVVCGDRPARTTPTPSQTRAVFAMWCNAARRSRWRARNWARSRAMGRARIGSGRERSSPKSRSFRRKAPGPNSSLHERAAPSVSEAPTRNARDQPRARRSRRTAPARSPGAQSRRAVPARRSQPTSTRPRQVPPPARSRPTSARPPLSRVTDAQPSLLEAPLRKSARRHHDLRPPVAPVAPAVPHERIACASRVRSTPCRTSS